MLTNPKIIKLIKNLRQKYKNSEIINPVDVPAFYLTALRSDASLDGRVIADIDGHELREGFLEIRGFEYILMQWNSQEVLLSLRDRVK